MINSILKYIKIIVKSNIFLIILFCLAGFQTFFPILSNGFMGDDFGQITSNIYIRSLRNIPMLLSGGTFYSGGLDNKLLSEYYRPLMIIWYSLIYSIFGLQPFYFHLLQIILHIINASLVYFILQHFLKDKKVSKLLSLLFLIHPINVEAVSYLGNIQDLLFFFFGALSFYLMIKNKKTIKNVVITEALFLLALLSKEIAIVFFIVLYSYIDLFKLAKIRIWYIILSIITIGVYLYMRCGIASICTLGGSNSVVPIARMSFLQRFSQIPAMLLFYIKTFIFPKDLAMFQYWIAPKTAKGYYIPLLIDLLFFLFIFSIPFILYIYRKKLTSYTSKMWFTNHSQRAKIYAFFLIWFLTGLVAHLNILPLDATVAERWFYFSFLGLLGIIGVLISLFNNKKWIYTILIIFIIACGVRSHARAEDWSSPYRLYSKDILISKNSASLENNYGAVLFDKGNIKEAELHFRNAINLAPHSPIYWSNLAEIYIKKGNNKKAEEYYLQSIKNGRFYVAFEGYAKLLLLQGKKTQSKQFLKEKAIPTFPFNQEFQTLYNNI